MTFTDTPIRHFKDDTLGRSGFAKQIGKVIYNLSDVQNGFVIAINGEWGSGKSSVMNMAMQTLKHLQMEKDSEKCLCHGEAPIKLNEQELDELAVQYAQIEDQFDFENYEYSYLSHDQFNKRVARTLDPADKLYRYFQLERYRRNNPENLIITFSPWLIPQGAGLASAFITDLTRSITPIFGEDVQNAFKLYAGRIAELEPLVSGLAKAADPAAGSFFSGLLSSFKTLAAKDKSLDTLKANLEKKLASLKHQKIVIVIDDLDRLTPTECAEMIGLVKGLGNLPNVVYLLGLHKEEVAKHLNTAHKQDSDFGRNYLGKILQYERDLPPASKENFAAILNNYTKEAYENNNRELIQRFENGWREYVRYKINTPRDAIKIGNHFKISYVTLKQFTDPVDLLLLETAKIKSELTYEFIRKNIAILNGSELPPYSGGDYRQQWKTWIDAQHFEERELTLLSLLFPEVAAALNMFSSSDDPSKSSINKRLNDKNFSKRYFEISPPMESWTKDELQNFISSTDPQNAIAQMIEKAKATPSSQYKLLDELLEEIDSRWEDVKDNLQAWFDAIIYHSSALCLPKDDGTISLGQIDNYSTLERITRHWIEKSTPTKRAEILLASIITANDLSLLCHIVRLAIKDIDETPSSKNSLNVDGKEDEIRQSLVRKIREAVNAGTFWHQASPADIIYFWNGAISGDEVRVFLNREISNKNAFQSLCDFALNMIYSTNGNYEYIPDYPRELMDIEALKIEAERIAAIPDDPLKPIAERFLVAYNNPRR